MQHVDFILPTISDTGASVPESCVFGMLLNLTVALSKYTNRKSIKKNDVNIN